jgi:mono/diheme cytochrome c family protein
VVSALRTVANVVEGLVLGAAAVTVVLLFTNSPTPAPAAPAEVVAAAGGVDGAAVFEARCAGCHGGDGSGGIGPRLADGRVVARFPDAEDQVVVVAEGRGGMPAFADRLTEEEIRAVVEYTRTVLAGISP